MEILKSARKDSFLNGPYSQFLCVIEGMKQNNLYM